MPTPIKLSAKVENIIHHALGVKSFVMKPLKPCPNFKPGQFLHLAIDEYDPSFHWPESRVFSIANSPTRRNKLKVTFSVKGDYTEKMYNEVKSGDVLWLKLPYGSFLIPDHDAEIVLIAGGTGITPFVSFLEYVIDNQKGFNIRLYYGVRSPEYLLFDSLLNECKKSLNNFTCHIYCETINNKDTLNIVNKGMLSIKTILYETIENKNSIYYLSGPQQMIFNFKKELIENDILENNIMIDEWE